MELTIIQESPNIFPIVGRIYAGIVPILGRIARFQTSFSVSFPKSLGFVSQISSFFFDSTIRRVGYRPVSSVSCRLCVGTFAETTSRVGHCAVLVAA